MTRRQQIYLPGGKYYIVEESALLATSSPNATTMRSLRGMAPRAHPFQRMRVRLLRGFQMPSTLRHRSVRCRSADFMRNLTRHCTEDVDIHDKGSARAFLRTACLQQPRLRDIVWNTTRLGLA